MSCPPPCQEVIVNQLACSAASRGVSVTVAFTVRLAPLSTFVRTTSARTSVVVFVNSGNASIAKIAIAATTANGRRCEVSA